VLCNDNKFESNLIGEHRLKNSTDVAQVSDSLNGQSTAVAADDKKCYQTNTSALASMTLLVVKLVSRFAFPTHNSRFKIQDSR